MYPSLGSARFGSARYTFEKARFLKNAQNEPIMYQLEKEKDKLKKLF